MEKKSIFFTIICTITCSTNYSKKPLFFFPNDNDDKKCRRCCRRSAAAAVALPQCRHCATTATTAAPPLHHHTTTIKPPVLPLMMTTTMICISVRINMSTILPKIDSYMSVGRYFCRSLGWSINFLSEQLIDTLWGGLLAMRLL